MKQISAALICFYALSTYLPGSVSATDWECGERSNLPIEGKNYCAAGDFRLAQFKMEKLLKKLLIKFQKVHGESTVMNDAQSAFEAYRENQCQAETKRVQDKPFYPMIVAQCKTRFTNLRIDELIRMQEKIN